MTACYQCCMVYCDQPSCRWYGKFKVVCTLFRSVGYFSHNSFGPFAIHTLTSWLCPVHEPSKLRLPSSQFHYYTHTHQVVVARAQYKGNCRHVAPYQLSVPGRHSLFVRHLYQGPEPLHSHHLYPLAKPPPLNNIRCWILLISWI